MASTFFKRLEDKYGTENIKKKKYKRVINEILAHNQEKVSNAMGRLSSDNYRISLKRLNANNAKTVKLPDISEVIPKRSVFMIKAAEKGTMITDTLRSRLEADLRATLKEFDGTGEKRMEIQRGTTTSQINPKLIESFKSRISTTFESYTKSDPTIGVPGNIRNIAVTEIRGTVEMIRAEYKNRLLEKNPQLEAVKTWIHNRQLSKVPRWYHEDLHLVTIPDKEKFSVSRGDGSAVDYMDRPHDPRAPASQVIGCNCGIKYEVRFKSDVGGKG